MARKKKDGYMPKSEVLLILQNYIRTIQMNDYGTDSGIPQLYKAMTYIEDAPTADVAEVRRGKWVHTDYAMHWLGKDECSECTYHTFDRDDLSHLKYCPNCGVRMDGDEDDV